MADNLALKLLVAGIIGAVVGAAAADRWRLPAGMMYGFNRPWTTTSRGAADGRGGGPERPPEDSSRRFGGPPDYYWPDWPPPRWQQARPRSGPRIALCWREGDDFRGRGRWVRCPPGVGSSRRDDG
jgi:hypothetical protein